MTTVLELKRIIDSWPTQDATGKLTQVYLNHGFLEINSPPDLLQCIGRVSNSDISLLLSPHEKAIPLGSTGDTSGALNLALAALRAHCAENNSQIAAALSVRAVTAIENTIRLENIVLEHDYNDPLDHLVFISRQAEICAAQVKQCIANDKTKYKHYIDQLQSIICALETAASFLRF